MYSPCGVWDLGFYTRSCSSWGRKWRWEINLQIHQLRLPQTSAGHSLLGQQTARPEPYLARECGRDRCLLKFDVVLRWKAVLIMKVKTEGAEGIRAAPPRNFHFSASWGQRTFPWAPPASNGLLKFQSDTGGIKAGDWQREALRKWLTSPKRSR